MGSAEFRTHAGTSKKTTSPTYNLRNTDLLTSIVAIFIILNVTIANMIINSYFPFLTSPWKRKQSITQKKFVWISVLNRKIYKMYIQITWKTLYCNQDLLVQRRYTGKTTYVLLCAGQFVYIWSNGSCKLL